MKIFDVSSEGKYGITDLGLVVGSGSSFPLPFYVKNKTSDVGNYFKDKDSSSVLYDFLLIQSYWKGYKGSFPKRANYSGTKGARFLRQSTSLLS